MDGADAAYMDVFTAVPRVDTQRFVATVRCERFCRLGSGERGGPAAGVSFQDTPYTHPWGLCTAIPGGEGLGSGPRQQGLRIGVLRSVSER